MFCLFKNKFSALLDENGAGCGGGGEEVHPGGQPVREDVHNILHCQGLLQPALHTPEGQGPLQEQERGEEITSIKLLAHFYISSFVYLFFWFVYFYFYLKIFPFLLANVFIFFCSFIHLNCMHEDTLSQYCFDR